MDYDESELRKNHDWKKNSGDATGRYIVQYNKYPCRFETNLRHMEWEINSAS